MEKIQKEQMEKFQMEIQMTFSQQLSALKEHMESTETNNCDAPQIIISPQDRSPNNSCSKGIMTNDEDFIKKITNFKEKMINLKKEVFKIELDHDKIEPYFYVDIDDLSNLIAGDQWLSIHILSLWYTYLHRWCISNSSSEQFGFFDPFRTFNNKSGGHSDEAMQAMRGYNILRGSIKNKKSNFISIKAHQQDNAWACGYDVMKIMFDIIQSGIFQGLHEIYDDPSPYNNDIIEDIRQIWAQFFLKIVEEQQFKDKEAKS